MRVAMVAPRYFPDLGGVETHVEQIAVRLAAAGCAVEVLTHRTARARAAVEECDGVRVRRFAQWSPLSAYPLSPALWRALRSRRGDDHVVHAHSYHATCGVAAWAAGSHPLVFTPHYHGTGHTRFAQALHVPYGPVGRRVLAAADRVICVSEVEAELLRRDFPGVATRLSVIPNGVDAGRLRDAAPFPGEPAATMLTVGRLEPYKGVGRAIEALTALPADHVLRIVGEGQQRAELEQLAARLQLGDRVRFLGRVSDNDLARWYRTARTVISMSRHEAFGLTVHEGVAAGAGVVASDVPAHREAAAAHDDGVTLVALDATPQELAAAIAGASRPGGESSTVADWDEIADRTLALYGEVTAAR